MTVKIPACSARPAAASSITPCCSQRAGSSRRMHSLTIPATCCARRKTSDDVDTLIGGEYLRKLIERTDDRLTEHGLGKGIRRDDPVAEALQSPRDGVTRTCAVGRQTDDRDGTGFDEECRDLLRRRIHEHGASVALAGRYV